MESLISGKHLDKLLKTISKVTGGMLEPTAIRRKAKAYADAKLTEAKGVQQAAVVDVETDAMVAMKKIQLLQSYPELALVSEEYKQLAERTAHRIFHQEIRRQNNLEAITAQAALALDDVESVSDKEVNEDWINNFANECQDIGDAEMQKIWGKILAGEVASPGSFSRRSLAILRQLNKEDLQLLLRFSEFIFGTNFAGPIAIVRVTTENDLLKKFGLFPSKRIHLELLGLVTTSITATIDASTNQEIWTESEKYSILANKPKEIVIICEALSSAGSELLRLYDGKVHMEYKEVVFSLLAKCGAVINKV